MLAALLGGASIVVTALRASDEAAVIAVALVVGVWMLAAVVSLLVSFRTATQGLGFTTAALRTFGAVTLLGTAAVVAFGVLTAMAGR